MTFTVVWLKSAERELTEIWLAAEDRSMVTDAASEIDRRLRVQPEREGESRDSGQRILLIAPLGVTFEVLSADRLVRVLDVWSFRTQG
jgi:mRNA-degrading endonuclease RelE of RelBE toxin-antitoxin system